MAVGVDTPLIIPNVCTTRQWNAAYFILVRARLRSFLGTIEGNPDWQHGQTNMQRVQEAINVMWPFYYVTQVTQSDHCGLIVSVRMWQLVVEHITELVNRLLERNPQLPLKTFSESIARRDSMMRKCNLFELAVCLWPNPAGVSMEVKAEASKQLRALINKQWTAWRRHPVAVGLPAEFAETPPSVTLLNQKP